MGHHTQGKTGKGFWGTCKPASATLKLSWLHTGEMMIGKVEKSLSFSIRGRGTSFSTILS